MTTALLAIVVSALNAQAPAHQGPERPRVTPEVWHPVVEHFSPAGDIQTEFGSALSETGYRKLLVALPWAAPSQRADYYFDAYDGHQFLLRTGGVPLKVRIKLKNQKSQWQVSRFVNKDEVQVGDLRVYLHTTESWEGRLDAGRANALLAASNDFSDRLAAGGSPLREAANRVDSAWQKLRVDSPPPGLMVIDHTLAGRIYRFFPRKVTPAKSRVTARLPGFAVTLSLGSEPETDSAGHAILTYGLEAEPDGAVTPAQADAIARAIGRWMMGAGLTTADQQEIPSESNDYTLHQLR